MYHCVKKFIKYILLNIKICFTPIVWNINVRMRMRMRVRNYLLFLTNF